MGRWTQYDEDDYRLPEGMKRIGYDADTMQYCFRDRDGSVWQGAEGADYGEMTRVDRDRLVLDDDENRTDDDEAHASPRRPRTQSGCSKPLSTEPSRSMADRSTINIGLFSLSPYHRHRPSPYLPIISGVWWSGRDSRFLQKDIRKAHHLTGPSLATVVGKYAKEWMVARKLQRNQSNVVCDPLT